MKKYSFEIRQIDAWFYDEQWNYNTTYYIGTMTTQAENIKKAFARYLKKQGIIFKKNRTRIEINDGGCIYEIIDRKTQEPLFCAIYMEV
ncbi:MAG: hypothetical protein J6Y47_03265 [Bacteroidales bacterium]|nr:hypothetical protein [Bacteroidales bacterium]